MDIQNAAVNLKTTINDKMCFGKQNSHPGIGFLNVDVINKEEPAAPVLSLGEKIVWLHDKGLEKGITKWIGRIPFICADWTAGIEFDNPIGCGDGQLNGKRYFVAKENHAYFLPLLGLLRADDYANENIPENELHLQKSISSIEKQKHDEIKTSDNLCNCKSDNTASLMQQNHHEKQKSTKSLIIGSLKRSQKKKLKKQNTFNPDHSVESPKLMKVRKNSTHSIASCPAVVSTEEWTVIDSDSDIEYKGGFHVLMSCFTLGGSYRQKKKKITATFMENEIYIPCEKRVDTPGKCENSNSIINERETEKSIIISDSIANPRAITCCTSPKQSLENVALKNSVRCIKRKKRKAPLPPNLTSSAEQICPLNNSKEFSKIDDLPTTIGKLYTFNKAPVNQQQSTQVISPTIQKTELSVLCQGKYARVLEEKKFSDLNDYDKKITPKKRKSPKKKPAPKPPVIPTVNSCIAINLSNNLDDIVNIKGKQPNEYSESSLLRSTVNNNNNNLYICNCASYKQHTFNYINIPHFVCPDLAKDADAYNVTVLGYFSIGRKNENSKEEIKFHKNGFQPCCQNESEVCISNNFNINQKHKQFIVPLNQRRKCHCNHAYQIESVQHNFEEKKFNEYSKEKFNLCADHHKFNNSILMCSCSNSHSIVNENELSKDDKYVSDDHIKEMFAKNEKQNCSAIDYAFNNNKSKSSQKVNKSEPFIGLEELIKSRPSVTDFIAAFNYLTQRNSDLDLTNIKISSENNYKKIDKIEEFASDDKDYDLKSLPTKWKYAPMDFHINKVKAMKLEKMHKNIKPLKSCLINKNNKKVTFENEIKSNESEKLNSKVSKIDTIPKVPYNYYVAAHKHARNQEYFNQKDRVKKNSFSKCNSKATEAYPDKKIIMNPNYRKSYRAPPIPDSENYHQKLHLSGQNRKKHSLEKIDEYEMMPKKYAGKIWVSLYIEDKSSHKGLIPLLISPTMTLGMLKERLERQLGYPKNLQRWILGKTFATDDNSTLAEYNVVEEGCPIFLYMTEKNPHNDYENFIYDQNNKVNDTIIEESESDSDISIDSDSGTVILASDTDILSESSESSGSKSIDYERKEMYSKGALLKTEVHLESKKSQRDISQKLDVAKENYKRWMEIEDQDLIKNLESFDCPICFSAVNVGDGVMLKECLHLFCKECLSDTVLYSEEAIIKCPFRNDEYSCNSFLQEREIKALVSPEVFERHLQRSIAAAESQAKNSFHCKTPDCPGWCLYEDKVNLFLCPVCSHLNCLTCQVIHEGRNCRQYQDELDFNSATSDEAKKTKDYLDKMLKEGEAMRCPQCHIILMKKWGCDWLKCSVCLTEICWVTKGYRWGPRGRGDTSRGCRCGVNGIRCHPKCKYCH